MLNTCWGGGKEVFPLGDVMGKSCLPWSPPSLPLFIALSIKLPSFSHLCSPCWQPGTVASFCPSSPRPGPEHVPSIRSCQRNVWKSLNAVAAKKPLSLRREVTGAMTRRDKRTLAASFVGLFPSAFPKNPSQRPTKEWWNNNTTVPRSEPWLRLCAAWPSCVLKMLALIRGESERTYLTTGAWMHWEPRMWNRRDQDPQPISYQNTIRVHYELIWIRRLERSWLFAHLWQRLPRGWRHMALEGNDCFHYPLHLQWQSSSTLWELPLRDYTTFHSNLSHGHPTPRQLLYP